MGQGLPLVPFHGQSQQKRARSCHFFGTAELSLDWTTFGNSFGKGTSSAKHLQNHEWSHHQIRNPSGLLWLAFHSLCFRPPSTLVALKVGSCPEVVIGVRLETEGSKAKSKPGGSGQVGPRPRGGPNSNSRGSQTSTQIISCSSNWIGKLLHVGHQCPPCKLVYPNAIANARCLHQRVKRDGQESVRRPCPQDLAPQKHEGTGFEPCRSLVSTSGSTKKSDRQGHTHRWPFLDPQVNSTKRPCHGKCSCGVRMFLRHQLNHC